MSTATIHALRDLFAANQVPFVADDRPKHMSGIVYYGLHKNGRCLYLTHGTRGGEEFLQVHVPKAISVADVEKQYGVKGEYDEDNAICNFARTYLLRVPVEGGRINGRLTIQEADRFFVDMARQR